MQANSGPDSVYIPSSFEEKKAQKRIIAEYVKTGSAKEKLRKNLPGSRETIRLKGKKRHRTV
jgi:precorrin-2 methylase